jgi:hypothetical protein
VRPLTRGTSSNEAKFQSARNNARQPIGGEWENAMRVIESTPDNQEVIRRLATAVVVQWQNLDQVTKDDLLREACFALDPDTKTISLREQILAFIKKHQE